MSDRTYIIEFKDDGSARVSSNIKKMGSAADQSLKKINSLKKSMRNIGQIGGGTSSLVPALTNLKSTAKNLPKLFNASSSSIAKMKNELAGLQSPLSKVDADFVDLGKSSAIFERMVRLFNRARSAVGQFRAAAERASVAMKKIKDRLFTLRNALRLVVLSLGTREIIRLSDSWTKVSNKVRIATDSTVAHIRVRKKLLDIARRTRSSIGGNVTLFQRLSLAQRNLGKSEKELLKFTEAVGQSLAITGATGEETRSTLIQLAQGLGSVAVRGDEFRAVMEAAPRLLQAVAEATNLSVSEIKKLTAEGKFLSKDFFEAVMSQSDELRRDFAKTASTFSQVGMVFRNVFTEITGKIGVETGFFSDIATGLLNIADAIRENLDVSIARVTVIRNVLKEFSARRGGTVVFLKTASLAGRLFTETIVAGFHSLFIIVRRLGVAFGESILTGIKTTSKKGIVDALSGKNEAKSFHSLLGKITGKKLAPTAAPEGTVISKISDDLKEINKELRETASDIFNKFYEEATNGSKTFNQAVSENLQSIQELKKETIDLRDVFSAMGRSSAHAGKKVKDEIIELLDAMAKVGTVPSFFDKISEGFGSFSKSFGASFRELNKDIMSFADTMATTVKDAIKGTSDELASMVVTGKADFKGLAQSIIQDMVSMLIQAQITKLAMAFLPGANALPGAQFGAPVKANQPTVVGERGPEIFVPPTAGRVMNNSQSQGGGSDRPIRIVNAVDGDALMRSLSPSVRDDIVLNSINNNAATIRGLVSA